MSASTRPNPIAEQLVTKPARPLSAAPKQKAYPVHKPQVVNIVSVSKVPSSILSQPPPKIMFKVYELPLFGVTTSNVNFRWTAKQEYERLGLCSMIKLRKVTISGSSLDGICGIQLIFTDGVQSPFFQSSKEKPSKSYTIDLNKEIQFIEGRVRDSRTNQLKFLDKNGYPILDSQVFYEDGNIIRHEIP